MIICISLYFSPVVNEIIYEQEICTPFSHLIVEPKIIDCHFTSLHWLGIEIGDLLMRWQHVILLIGAGPSTILWGGDKTLGRLIIGMSLLSESTTRNDALLLLAFIHH